MKITFLGTGSSTPTPKTFGKPFRSYASTMVETKNEVLLFDIGPGTIVKMLGLGMDILKKPTHVFLSHFHLDHCLDIVTLMKARGLRFANTGEKNMLNIYGPTGLEKMLEQLFSGVKKWNYMTHELKVNEIMNLTETMEGMVVENQSFKVICTPIKHYDGVAYRLDAEGKSIAYSGDMGYDVNFARLGKDVDLAIVECSYPDRKSLKGLHLCPEDIAQLAKMGNFKQTALTHMYPECEGREDGMKSEIEGNSSTKVSVAEDFFEMIV